MSEKKRKSKRPKAMRVTTEASTAKLPKPRKRKRKATPRETWAEGYAKWEAKAGRIPRVRCPRCEKLVLAGPHDIHTCYDAKALREASPIAGQPIDGIGSVPASDLTAIPCGVDLTSTSGSFHGPTFRVASSSVKHPQTLDVRDFGAEGHTPPDTSAYPWPLKFAWWLDGVPTRVRRWLAVRLRWLAGKVEP